MQVFITFESVSQTAEDVYNPDSAILDQPNTVPCSVKLKVKKASFSYHTFLPV